MQSSQNIPLPLRIYPHFQQMYICATLPEYTPPYQNTPPFSTTKCDPPRIYPPPPPRIYPSFQQLYYYATGHTPRIYPSQNIPPPFQQLYATLLEITPPSENTPPPPLLDNYMPPSVSEYIPPHLSTIICDIPRIYPSVTEYAPFSRRFCNYERIYHLLPELKNILGGRGRFWEGRI